MFSHLHVHSEYSLLESSIKIKDLVKAASESGMKSVALTDKYVMSGAIEFYREAMRKNIKPIIGCEVCILHNRRLSHLVVLVKNAKGYENLCQIISKSHLERKAQIPVVELPYLKEMGEGLIGLSGCSRGEIPYLLKEKNVMEAIKSAKEYRELFEGDFYVGIQRYPAGQSRLCKTSVSEILINFARKVHLPIVATNNVHYLSKRDYKIYKSLFKLKLMSIKNDPTAELIKNSEHYFKSASEMEDMFSDIPEAIINTETIVDKCNFNFTQGKINIPYFKVPEGESQESYLKKLCCRRLKGRYGERPSLQVRSRLSKELGIIAKTGFSGYFLIVADIARFVHKKGIPICGKGSSAGSIVSYILGISNVDPIKCNLYFERFLNEKRRQLPDIDIDIPHGRRVDVLKYLSLKYGEKNIVRVCCFSTIKLRAAIRETGRILGSSKEDIDQIIKAVPDYKHFFIRKDMGRTIRDYKYIDTKNTQYRRIASISEKIEGYVRHLSTHPSAFIISSCSLAKKIPLTLSETGEIMSQYDMKSVEDLGLLKIDLINSLSLSLLGDVADMLKKKRNINLNVSEIKYDDKETFSVMKTGKTLGVFQLESFGIRTLAKKIKPASLNDIALLISLYRPGPQQSGMVNSFIERKFGREKVTYLHKDLEPILDETYGIILYQEQVMQIALGIAGYSLAEADSLRKVMTKRSGEEMRDQEARFLRGAMGRGYDVSIAKKIFKLISKFASYGFVKAHAAAYSELSYKTCYLKAHYPAELISVILSDNSGYYDRQQYIEEARRLGIRVRLPDINESGLRFSVEDKGRSIRTSLLSIGRLGHVGANSIVGERKRNGNFKDIFNFYRRTSKNCKVTKKAIENLIRVGAFDFTNLKRKYLLLVFYYLKNLKDIRSNLDDKNCFFFKSKGYLEDFNLEERLEAEEEILGFFVSTNPLQYFKDELKELNVISSKYFSHAIYTGNKKTERSINCTYLKDIFVGGIVIARRIEKTKKGKAMLFCTLEDESGMYESVFFPDIYKKNAKIIMNETPVVIKGRLYLKDEHISIVARDVISLISLKKLKRESRRDYVKNNLLMGVKPAW